MMPPRDGSLESDHVQPVHQLITSRPTADDRLTERFVGSQQSVTEDRQLDACLGQQRAFYAKHQRLVPDRVARLTLRRCLLTLPSGRGGRGLAAAASHDHSHTHQRTYTHDGHRRRQNSTQPNLTLAWSQPTVCTNNRKTCFLTSVYQHQSVSLWKKVTKYNTTLYSASM